VDKDGVGDNADTDDDNDGLGDEEEISLQTDPLKPDTDGEKIFFIFVSITISIRRGRI
jgi:hypothetical protein